MRGWVRFAPKRPRRTVRRNILILGADGRTDRPRGILMTQLVQFSNSPEIFEAADRLFDRVSRKIGAVLPSAEIYHVGATAVPGSLTKGDLDVLVRVSRGDFQEADRALAEMYRRNVGSIRTDTFSAFMDESTSPELGVQLVVGGSELDTFVQWVRRLESDSALRAAYDALKARYHSKPMSEYRDAKSAFIARHMSASE